MLREKVELFQFHSSKKRLNETLVWTKNGKAVALFRNNDKIEKLNRA